jgi:hypothetical protein
MEYPFIQAWGARMGSFKYYIDGQVEEAKKDKAPATAIYKSHDTGKWRTIDDVSNPEAKEFCLAWVAKKSK